MSSSSALLLCKLYLPEDEIRRIRIPRSQATFENLKRLALNYCPEIPTNQFARIKYKDDEGEWILADNDEDLLDAFQENTIKIQLQLSNKKLPSTSVASSSQPVVALLQPTPPKEKANVVTLSQPLKNCHKLLTTIKSHNFAWPFNQPVDPVMLGIPDYFAIIKQPMDLGTVEEKLLKGQYPSPKEFAADVNLVWQNCFMYNQPNSDVVRMAETLKRQFDNDFRQITGESATATPQPVATPPAPAPAFRATPAFMPSPVPQPTQPVPSPFIPMQTPQRPVFAPVVQAVPAFPPTATVGAPSPAPRFAPPATPPPQAAATKPAGVGAGSFASIPSMAPSPKPSPSPSPVPVRPSPSPAPRQASFLGKPKALHVGYKCDSCGILPIEGTRFSCKICDNYDLCEYCHRSRINFHDPSHAFVAHEQEEKEQPKPFNPQQSIHQSLQFSNSNMQQQLQQQQQQAKRKQYESQLKQLDEMGLLADEMKCLQLLDQHKGDIAPVIENIVSNM